MLYVAFATHLGAARAWREIRTPPEDRRKRRGIETGYGQIEDVRPWTSRDPAFRLMLFYSLFTHNMWAIERRGEGTNPAEITPASIVRLAALIILHDNGVPVDPDGPG